MSLIKEFREFAVHGNVFDLAVGVIIGTAFGKIIQSAVNDLIMPPIGKLLNGVQFQDLFYPLNGVYYETLAKAKEAGAPVLAYGSFIQSVVDFLIIVFAIFLAIKGINRFRKSEEPASDPAPVPTNEEKLLTEIRDLLKAK
jgi:large conductance mechanosensitive channel